MYVYVKHIQLMTFWLVAVRKVAAGHKMVAQGHATVAEGWDLFEEAVEEAGPSDLPILLHQLKGKTTPMQMPTPPPQASLMEVGEKTPMLPPASPVKKDGVCNKNPVIVMVGGLESGPALSATQYGGHKMGVMPISGRPIQEKPLYVPSAVSPAITWTQCRGMKRNINK